MFSLKPSTSMPPASGRAPRVKGLAIRRALEHLERLNGPDQLERAHRDFPDELATSARYGRIAVSSWYPLEWLRTVHAALRRMGNAGPELPRSLGRRSAYLNFKSVHRAFIAVLSPEFLIARAPRVFASYYDTGSMTIVESRSGMTHAIWSGCAGFDRNLWEGTLGHCEGALDLAGAGNIRMKIENGGNETDDYMEAIAFWTE
jgi:hypothetical protein